MGKIVTKEKVTAFALPKKFPILTAWSFSLYRRYCDCPLQVALDKALKQKMQNMGMSEGIDMHSTAEAYVAKTGKYAKSKKVPIALKLVEEHAVALREDASTQVELEMAYTKLWKPTTWFGTDTWLRIKIDARRILSMVAKKPKVVEITDWKGGKAYAHWDQQQAELYALGEFKLSGCAEVRTKFAHTSTGDETDGIFLRSEEKSLEKVWLGRTKKLLNDQLFKPTPGRQCTWCPHRRKDMIDPKTGKGGNGVCPAV